MFFLSHGKSQSADHHLLITFVWFRQTESTQYPRESSGAGGGQEEQQDSSSGSP